MPNEKEEGAPQTLDAKTAPIEDDESFVLTKVRFFVNSMHNENVTDSSAGSRSHQLDYEQIEELLALTPKRTPLKPAGEFSWGPTKSWTEKKPASMHRLITGEALAYLSADSPMPTEPVPPRRKRWTIITAIIVTILVVALTVVIIVDMTKPQISKPVDLASVAAASRAKLAAGKPTYPDCPTCLVPSELPKDFDGSYTVGEDPAEDDRDEGETGHRGRKPRRSYWPATAKKLRALSKRQ